MIPSLGFTPPLLTPQEQEENEARKKKLFDFVASEIMILFVGAGSSASLGYPLWPQLLAHLEDIAHSCSKEFLISNEARDLHPLEYADKIKDHINKVTGSFNQFYAKIHELYKPNDKPLEDLQKLLLSLPFKGFVTTNYDLVLEKAMSELNLQKPSIKFGKTNIAITQHTPPIELSEFFLSLDDKQIPKRILHLHGIYDDTDSIVLSLNDYKNKYGFDIQDVHGKDFKSNWTMHRKVLWSLLATRRLLFVGFSLEDPYFQYLLESVNSDLWKWNNPQHFAIVPINQGNSDAIKNQGKHLRENSMVEVIYYESHQDSPFQKLNQLIFELARYTQTPILLSNWIDTINERMRSG